MTSPKAGRPALQMITGGLYLSPADSLAELAAVEFEPMMDSIAAGPYAKRAEKGARMAAGLIAPGVAIVSKTKSELVQLVAAYSGEAEATHDALKEAVAAAQNNGSK